MPIRLISGGGGSVSLNPGTTAATTNLTVPAVNGSIITTADTGTVAQPMLASNLRVWELITTQTVVPGNQVTLDNIFTTTYDYYTIYVTGLTATTNDYNVGADGAIRFIDSSGNILTSSLYSTNQYWARSTEGYNSTVGNNIDHGAFSRRMPSASGSRGYDGEWKIHRPMDANIGKRMYVYGGQDSYDDTITVSAGETGYRAKVAIRGLYVWTYGDNGGWSGGTFKVFGMRG